MGTTVPSEVEGGSDQEKKTPEETLEGDESADSQPDAEGPSGYCDLNAMSNPPASSLRMDSSSPLQALRKFAGTPENKKATTREEKEENSSVAPEPSEQVEEPISEGKVKMVRTCSLGESKAREARSKVAVLSTEKKEVSAENEEPPLEESDETDMTDGTDEKEEEIIPDNVRHRFGSDSVDILILKEQKKTVSYSEADGDKKRATPAYPAQRKMENLLDAECEEGRTRPAPQIEKKGSSCKLATLEDEQEEAATSESEEPAQIKCKEELDPGLECHAELDEEDDVMEEDATHKSYKQLGQALRANTFPGMPVPMKSLSQETYTKEVNDIGRLEKSKSQHWHGKKSDPLGHWHERNFSNLNLLKALQEKNQEKLKKN
ncbi:ciliary microtubule inner protein 4 isoform X2 [Ambystoma mexicanum]|uniref:ciliary microtubule inner protein 4 isoform X2 n=1 Tax=Ambystoma mexicanum TaxID=8296 RepID=UPI0037E8DD74